MSSNLPKNQPSSSKLSNAEILSEIGDLEIWRHTNFILRLTDHICHYGSTGCGVFKRGVQCWKDFLPKNQHSQRKLLNFENWCNEEVSKSARIFYVKYHWNLCPFFFSLKNINLAANFLLLTFFDNINFEITLFSKMITNFWHLPIKPMLKIQ